MGCLFCEFAADRLETERFVYEDEYIFAFHEKYPQAPFHILIITKRHIESAARISEEDSFLIAKINVAAAVIAREQNLDNNFTLLTRAGEGAGQTIPHLHFHMLSGVVVDLDTSRVPGKEPCPDCRFAADLQYRASTDAMTGAYNREWGLRLLERKLAEPDTAGSLAFLDIDGLKRTNDTHGHAAGDELLYFATCLIRMYIPEDAIFCRWGGDEFLLYTDSSVEEASELLNWIQGEMDRVNNEEGRAYRLSFSYGIVPFIHGKNASLDALVTEADQRMYLNKTDKYGQRRRWSDKV